jgi:predicted RNA binding protein YcfA (HicA-like mRNA interferase family)
MKPVSGKWMCKVLERRGWRFIRTASSHHVYKHPESTETISVPVHGNHDLAIGTQKGIMRDAGLKDADLAF